MTSANQIASAEWIWSSYFATNRYDFTIFEADLAKTPVWRHTDDHPPLAARKALQLARARLQELVPDSKAWTLEGLSLTQIRERHWIYLGIFELLRDDGIEGLPPRIVIPILMNGVAVKPKASAWPR